MTDTINDNKSGNNSTESAKPRFTDIIDGYINTNWRPTRGFNPDNPNRFRLMTSQEIVLELTDMVDLELNDVAAAMIYLGYRTIIYDDKVGWLLERRG